MTSSARGPWRISAEFAPMLRVLGSYPSFKAGAAEAAAQQSGSLA